MNEHGNPPGPSPKVPVFKIIIALSIIALCCAVIFLSAQNLETQRGNPGPKGDLTDRNTPQPTITYNGNAYRSRDKLTTIAVMGVDQYAASGTNSAFRHSGQADYLLLLVLDDDAKTITPIQIDRDTMAEVTTLSVLGKINGTRLTQICLAYGFGDGGSQSARLTADAVSRLLLGTEIQFFVSMKLEGISTLNDALGGITVTLEDDFTSLNSAMKQGATLTLQGMQAEYFVRSRLNVGVGTNEARMKRQGVYWDGMTAKLAERLQETKAQTFLNKLLDDLNPYLLTDMRRGRLINEIWRTRDYDRAPIIHPTGEYRIGEDGFVEFHTDQAALEQLVLNVFYNRVF